MIPRSGQKRNLREIRYARPNVLALTAAPGGDAFAAVVVERRGSVEISAHRSACRRTATPNVCRTGSISSPRGAVCAGPNAGEGVAPTALSRR
jgi:hypothetical protein